MRHGLSRHYRQYRLVAWHVQNMLTGSFVWAGLVAQQAMPASLPFKVQKQAPRSCTNPHKCERTMRPGVGGWDYGMQQQLPHHLRCQLWGRKQNAAAAAATTQHVSKADDTMQLTGSCPSRHSPERMHASVRTPYS